MKNKLKELFPGSIYLRLLCNSLLAVLMLAVYGILVARGAKHPIFLCILTVVIYVIILLIAEFVLRVIEAKKPGVQTPQAAPILTNVTLDVIVNMYMPVLVCDTAGKIIWSNRAFTDLADRRPVMYGELIDKYAGTDIATIAANEEKEGAEIMAWDSCFHVKAYRISSHGKQYYLTLWNDKSDFFHAAKRLSDEDTLVAYIMIDNLEELRRYVQDKTSDAALEAASVLKQWVASVGGVLKEYERDKYIMLCHAACLSSFTDTHFDILDRIRDVRVGEGDLPITVSIGIAKVEGTLADKERAASAALDMALSRGGDQVVVKTDDGMDFYGGKTKTMQKRTKVRARVVANELAMRMTKSSNVLIMCHKNPDFDALGAAVGIARLSMFCGVRVNIITNFNDPNFKRCLKRLQDNVSDYRKDSIQPIFISPTEAPDLVNPDTLLVIVDVNNRDQFEVPDLIDIAQTVVIIDHHRKTAEFDRKPAISDIETSVSSTCEQVSEILEHSLPAGTLQKEEANLLYAGMMLDTKQFTHNTGVRTFSALLYLRGEGANPTDATQLFKTSLNDLISEAKFESNVSIYRDFIAISVNDREDNTPADRISAAKAADKFLTVDGILASFAICRIQDVLHVSARSSGAVNVQLILEKLNGGGHFDAAATQMQGVTTEACLKLVKDAIDEYLDEQ